MHKSRLGVVVIDCRTDDLDREAKFWAAALGRPAVRSDDPATQIYRKLETAPEEMQVLLQKVDHPSRVHLDIESSDIDAEAARLEKLGAKRIAQVKSWWVMEAPSGQRFCVVKPQRADFDQNANEWP